MLKKQEVKMKKNHITRNLLILLVTAVFLFPWSVMAEDQLTDMDISIAVENQIFKDPGVSFNTIDVNTVDGIVTVSGTVKNILARDRAVKVARTVKGVRSVVDRIVVNPPGRPDEEIKKDIERAFILDPLSESWEVDLRVNNQKVTLYGTVDSWAERDLVAKIAKGVRGVTDLENNIGVDIKTERNDTEIREEIDRRLHWDALVDDYLIDVKVNDGKVVLTGTVGSAAERVQAHRDAMVAGVKEVDSSGLEVKWWGRNENLRRDKYALRPDNEIRQAVKDAFLFDPRVNMFDIKVSVDNGRVTLNGTVDNLKAKRAAAKDARNTVGVWHVRNFIKVRPGTPTDKESADNIREALDMNPYIERYIIDVSVEDGEATLKGTIDNFFEKSLADDVAAGIYGVTEVHNRIRVEKPGARPYNPYVDESYTYDYNWYLYPYYLPVMSDSVIKKEIEEEIFWSPFVDNENVTVTVDKGIATLTGKVGSLREYNAAEENALEGGAISVDNEIEIRNRTE